MKKTIIVAPLIALMVLTFAQQFNAIAREMKGDPGAPVFVGVQTAKAFHYTGNGYNDGVSAAREDAASGQNDNSCNDHFSNNPNFNLGNEVYCAGFKVGYTAEMAAAGATK